jgi:hypothetical protein
LWERKEIQKMLRTIGSLASISTLHERGPLQRI